MSATLTHSPPSVTTLDASLYLKAADQIAGTSEQSTPLWTPLPGPQTDAYESEADELFYGGAAGGGKALALDTPIPTPLGWRTMGEIEVGEYVFDEHGRPCRVLATSDIMTGHRVYEVVFDDGSTIVADADHRWLTFTVSERNALHRRSAAFRERRRATRELSGIGKRPDLSLRNRLVPTLTMAPPTGTVRTTADIATTLYAGERLNHSVSVSAPLQLPDIALPIDPYVLGAWLGDGSSYGNGITCADTEILVEIQSAGHEITQRSGSTIAFGILGIQAHLRALGLLGNKHIPARYLRASEVQRLSLLQGLMDTDGSALRTGKSGFYTTNERLAQDTYELLCSLGFKTSIREGRATLNRKDCGPKFRLEFTTSRPVFRLSRKLDRLPTSERGVQSRRYIVACRPVDSVPVRCITVDSSSHLYLAGRSMIPTHNSDLLLGLATTAHHRSIIFRREFPQLSGMIDRSREIIGTQGRYNEAKSVWRLVGNRVIELGSVPHESDKDKYQGRPHDLKAFDELPTFTESQYLFLIGWNRTTDQSQRSRAVGAGNPPTGAEGEWVIRRWAPWLDPQHTNPAKPGELRWFAVIDGKDTEVEGPEPFEHNGETVVPKSRTFIPARLSDNPYLMATDYGATLQRMPEPLRSQMLYGDFSIGQQDNPWQIIPTAWVRAAQARWDAAWPTTDDDERLSLDTIGVDVARGGQDKTVLVRRVGSWFSTIDKHPGAATPNGHHVVGLILPHLQETATVNIDVIGVGASPYDILVEKDIAANGVNFGAGTKERDKSGKLGFANVRALCWWRMREALDPDTGDGLALPPDSELLADLTAPRWSPTARGIQVESKDDVIKRIGRSPDCGDAAVLALIAPPAVRYHKNPWY